MKKKLLSVICLTVMLATGCGFAEALPNSEGGNTNIPRNEGEYTSIPENEAKKDTAIPLAGETVIQPGPFGSISLVIPEGWAYESCGVDEDALFTADYGICIYPSEAAEGSIEIGYHSSFGVCGTGLITLEQTLAGDKASVGYYDGHSFWDFVSFRGINEGIVAQCISVDSWDESYMDQAMNILDSVIYNPNEQSGAIGIYESDSEISEISLMVSAENISSTKATLVFHQYDNSITTELFFGEDFKIEKKDGASWKETDIVVDGDYAYKSIAYLIDTEGTTEYEYNWEWLYGSLDAGDYRIAVHVTNFRDTGDYDEFTAYAHFLIR